MNYENIVNGLSKLKENNLIKNYSYTNKIVGILFSDIPKPIFIKPCIDENEIIKYLKKANSTTIEILKCIIENITLTNTFPTQKQIAKIIHKDITTVCKYFSKLKSLNIIYKGKNHKYNLSELNNDIKKIIML